MKIVWLSELPWIPLVNLLFSKYCFMSLKSKLDCKIIYGGNNVFSANNHSHRTSPETTLTHQHGSITHSPTNIARANYSALINSQTATTVRKQSNQLTNSQTITYRKYNMTKTQ